MNLTNLPLEIILHISDFTDLRTMLSLKNICKSNRNTLQSWFHRRMTRYLAKHLMSFDDLLEASFSELFLYANLVSLLDRRRPFSKINFINTFMKKGFNKIKIVKSVNYCNILVYDKVNLVNVDKLLNSIVMDGRQVLVSDNYTRHGSEINVVKTCYETIYEGDKVNDNLVICDRNYTMITYDIFY
jgi:hypothetical protein